jgi:hypothetical protein
MNVVLQKILGTLYYQVRIRTSSGNTHKCYLTPCRGPEAGQAIVKPVQCLYHIEEVECA